jgi:hypothetical protein
MKTIRSIAAGNSHRLPARLKLISTRVGSLILLFQRMPVVQFLFPEANIIGGASVANTISLAVTTVVGLGAYDSVAGATTIDEVQPLAVTGYAKGSTLATNAINVPATVSDALNFKFKCDTAPSSPESWKITTGTLPAGLAMDHTSSVPLDPNTADPQDFPTITYNHIKGTPGPTTTGIHPLQIRVYRDPGQTGDNITQLFNICVLGFKTQHDDQQWRNHHLVLHRRRHSRRNHAASRRPCR